MKVRDVMPTAENTTNFDIMPDSDTQVGTTLENLKSAVNGETGASAKYAEFSKLAKEAGYDQISRQFACTSAAEQIHIALEVAEIKKKEPDYVAPSAP
ncbi:MAG: rubrerythrin family protein, partial [Eggerthellaceae bacterium]|nr:rubrerythrin family protein [Eggerthellaceae bacterium]